MPILNIKDPHAHELATEIARITGESLTDVVLHALDEHLQAIRSRDTPGDRLRRVLGWLKDLPEEAIVDRRTADEILGYDENGLPQ